MGLMNVINGVTRLILGDERLGELVAKRDGKSFALTCRKCGKLAYPLLDTGNRYRCYECGNQFAAARHNCVLRQLGED